MKTYLCESERFRVRYTLEQNPNSKKIDMHAHEHFEVFYFIAGTGRFWVEGTPYSLKPHDIMVFNCSEAHRIDISEYDVYERVVIDIRKDYFETNGLYQPLLEPFIERPLGQDNLFHSEEFGDSFYKRCLQKMMTRTESPELQAGACLTALLNEIYNVYLNRRGNFLQSQRISSQIVSYINANLSQDITPESIADKFFISRSHLYSLFKETTGSSVRRYITVKRLLLAKELLMNGNHPSDVYSLCGFNDYSSFFRAYKNKFGVSPREDYKK